MPTGSGTPEAVDGWWPAVALARARRTVLAVGRRRLGLEGDGAIEARMAAFPFIEGSYNPVRRHSMLG